MELSLIIFATIVLFFQFLLDYILDFLIEKKKLKKGHSKKVKIIIGLIILVIGLSSIWLNFAIQRSNQTREISNHKMK